MSEIRLEPEEITRRIKIGIKAAKHYDKVIASMAKKTSKKNEEPELKGTDSEPVIKEELARKFVASIFETVASEKYVRINLPKPTAKEMKSVPDHNLLVFSDWTMESLVGLNVEAHYFINDLPMAGANGSLKPRVVRHFYAKSSFQGQTILASVTIKIKTDLLTEGKMVIVDIHQIFPKEPVEVSNILRIGTKVTGAETEAAVPDSNLCVKFEKIRPQMILATKTKTEVIFTPKESMTAEFAAEKAEA